uniref:SPRY domain-containing protein 7 n=1 Tax=Acrobeloides nanus TaxID=290746 RepID=A0A914DRG1_9BILA
MGSDVVLLKNGTRICGTGAALATAPIVQSKAYFQINIQQSGVWGVGVANRKANLSKVPVIDRAWLLRNDGKVVANGEEIGHISIPFEEGDSIGVAFDHVELKFYKGGELLPVSITNVREQVFPIIYVDDSAIIDVKFSSFSLIPPPGYQEIMIEQTLL